MSANSKTIFQKNDAGNINQSRSSNEHNLIGMNTAAEENKNSPFRLPESLTNVWNSFRTGGGEQKGTDANGFVLIDKLSQAVPSKTAIAQQLAKYDNGKSSKLQNAINSLPPWTGVVVVGVGAAALIVLLAALSGTSSLLQRLFDVKDTAFVNWDVDYNVAFIGNSYLFVNDIPRVMEAISEGHIQQNSCLNTAGSLGKLLRTGNGMYDYWNTETATVYANLSATYDFIDEDYQLYDYGACSVYQLLEGYDNDLVYQNYNDAYYDEGFNPCFEDEYYLGLLTDRLASNQIYWDFVVLNDQSRRMAFEDAREDTIYAIKYAYAPMIADARAVPIVVDTHAYFSEQGNETGLDDIAYFTAEMYKGLREYYLALELNLPEALKPRVAKIGLAYLTVYEENQEFWENLFLFDKVHSSARGSYLFACVLYATIFGHLPRSANELGGTEALFERSRYIQDYIEYPDNQEATYLRNVAKRVVLDGYVPNSLQMYTDVQFKPEDFEADEDEWQFYSNGDQVEWDEAIQEELSQEEIDELESYYGYGDD